MFIEFINQLLLLNTHKSILPVWLEIVLFFLLTALSFYVAWLLLIRKFSKKILQQQEAFERRSMLEKERMRVAMDLHDDIGASLTALTLLTSILSDVEIEESGKGVVKKINEVSEKMVQDMNEIVWALNATNDTLPNLMAYTRQTISNLLSNAGIAFEESEPISYPMIFVSGTARRDVFMVIKELVNNAIRHSGSKRLKLDVTVDNYLRIVVTDFGRGMDDPDFSVISNGGNGLNNVKRRVESLGGEIAFKNQQGLTVSLSIPLENFKQAD
ncbi:MAG: sensor histidine kinase [bacterium]|jgi:signal transduction histidine kinase